MVSKDLDFATEQKDLPVSMSGLHTWLEQKIADLLDHDPTRLMQALYRIDVDEDEVRRAFAGLENLAETLSSLIIQRVQQKIATRQKYRGY